MKLIVGLGNPGIKYRLSRHNAGFLVVDRIAAGYGISIKGKRLKSKVGSGVILDQQVLLAKPLTFMNRSGEAVARLVERGEVDVGDLLIICDDTNLEPGVIRLRRGGSAGGHNGLISIIEWLGTQKFPRLKIGVGRPRRPEALMSFVLRPFPRRNRSLVEEVFQRAAEASVVWLAEGIEAAMNKFNVRPGK